AHPISRNPAPWPAPGMDRGAIRVATSRAAAIGSHIMGFVANYPIAQAPGRGLTAVFTYTVVLGRGYTGQGARAAVWVSGGLCRRLSI
ncbi:NCS2 family permease, partial [Vibrio parahaemolyticus]|nr:NCS2 family permease [Vibrio parahaemolyticus]